MKSQKQIIVKNVLVLVDLGYRTLPQLTVNFRKYSVTVADLNYDEKFVNKVSFVKYDIKSKKNIKNVFKNQILILYII